MNDYDVIVVGTGHAGATSARVCAQHNLKTLFIEKKKSQGTNHVKEV